MVQMAAGFARALGGDRVQVLYKPRTFTAFGASEKVEQVPLNAAEVTLAEG